MSLFKKISFSLRKMFPNNKRTLYSNTVKNINYHQSLLISSKVDINLNRLTQILNNSQELITKIIKKGDQYFGVAYLSSVTNKEVLQHNLNIIFQQYIGDMQNYPIVVNQETSNDYLEIIEKLHCGSAVFFIEDNEQGLLFDASKSKERNIEQPDTQSSSIGLKDGFVESAQTNLFLIRSKLKDSQVRLKKVKVGTRTKSSISIMYIEDLARPEIVKSVMERISSINVDSVLDSAELSQYLDDSWLSPFPQLEYSERPDTVTSSLCQGRVAIIHENSPGVLIAPTTFFDLIDVPDDYYNRWFVSASIIRFIRLMAAFLATFLPSFYIALTAYNPDFLPTSLALRIAALREGIPFPTPVEAFITVSIVEITREAVYRLSTIEAQVTGIVGLLVISGTLVFSNIISPPIIAIIGVGIICSSVIPNHDLQISLRELQFFYMILASFMGIFGVAMAFFYTSVHVVTLKSFGVPYMSPVAPIIPKDWLRLLVRLPAWALPRLKSYHCLDEERFEKTVDRKEGDYS